MLSFFHFGSTEAYEMPAIVFNTASNITRAPSGGTAMPICFRTLSFEP